ncbi:MAG: hydrogenase nickel incorporation protein HypB [Deltaproteobacteria bacterium]|uniref:Hydrogenase nickel incorporation protein HypB n=1 Tax=Candidatus Zymogenus saltonus TaxID=2844893 RepID=A0A9D8KDI2_9DELT|nr:hydrogenase nickel incorporation protein HypB [Candidatus Zymogenus saltonus]
MAVKLVVIKEDILKDNNEMSAMLRDKFKKNKTLVMNLMSSPGAGKTSVILETLGRLGEEIKSAVIEGDVTSTVDAEKLDAVGVPTLQINTGGSCHIDSAMIEQAIVDFDVDPYDFIIVENVGNLVCPAEFEVGEDIRVMILSVPEGHDKPKKYPLMFTETEACLLNKIDLLPYTDFDMDEFKDTVKSLNPKSTIFPVSMKTKEGIDDWVKWLKGKIEEKMGG